MLRPGQILQLTAIAMLGFGIVMIHSAGMRVGGEAMTQAGDLLTSRTVVYALFAIVVMFAATWLNVREIFASRGLANPLWMIVLGSLILLALTQVPGLGKSVNGATRWLRLGPESLGLSFQPSELVKITIIIALASWCRRRAGSMHKFWQGLFPPLLLLGLACGLIVLEDLGTAALLGFAGSLLLIAGGARVWQVGGIGVLGVGGLATLIYMTGWRVGRIEAYLEPWDALNRHTYHPMQSMIAIASGGATGSGLGNGVQKFGYLPEDTTDFIFSVICEELGIAGAALVVVLIGVLIWSMYAVARECKDPFGRLMALGFMITIGLQAMINLMVVTVLIPTKGIALPFISSGGTGWALTALAVGLVAAIDRDRALDEEVALEAEFDEDDEPLAAAVT